MASRRPDRRGFDKLLYEQHVERIRSMKGTVDNKPPRPHPLSNKSDIDKRRKFAAIELDNRLLLERLSKIVQNKTIDNEVHESVNMQKTFKAKLLLNRKRIEAQKITEENRRILHRIQEVPPVYNHIEWETAAKERENTLKHMLIYPEYYTKRLEERSSVRRLGDVPMLVSSSNAETYEGNEKLRSQTAPANFYSQGTINRQRVGTSKTTNG